MEAAGSVQRDCVLEGVTVLEVGVRIGTSVAGCMLAQLGAEVVFVEMPQARGARPSKLDWRAQFAAGKLSLAPEPGSTADRDLLAGLARSCDVLLLSSDLDPQALHGLAQAAADAGAIVCDLTAFGSSGPLASLAYSDAQVQALTGILECTGTAAGEPMPIPVPIVEHLAGVYAAGGVLCALRERRLRGVSQSVELALYDVAFGLMNSFLAPAFAGHAQAATRVGNRHPMAAPWNVYRASDGWILLCAGSDEQWRRICRLIGRESLADDPAFLKNADRVARVGEVDTVVQEWVGQRSMAECMSPMGELGLPCGPVAPIDAYPREDNLSHRGMICEAFDPVTQRELRVPGSPLRMSRSPGRALVRIPAPDEDRAAVRRLADVPPARTTVPAAVHQPGSRPLEGIRVLEIGHYTTVPIATRTLASLGAEVIKIEPTEGEAVRGWPPTRSGQGIFFTFQNSDKKSVCLDLESEADRAVLAQLIASADVLVENLRPGALARRGFAWEELERINPRLVYCSISGFGADSLYPGRAAFDMVIQAMSGLMDVTHVDGIPLKTGPSCADILGAACGFATLVAALEYRDRTGHGQNVDLSMQDIAAWATQTLWNAAPRAPLPRVAMRDGRYVFGEGGDAVPVLAVREVLDAPQTQARGLWFLADAAGTQFPLLAVPLRLSATPAVVKDPAPPLGQHNLEVLRSLQQSAHAPPIEQTAR